MASQSLYRKWRSQTFQELIGQEAVVRTLKNALQSGRIAHAYLFCGPRGTGKTSAARLLAKTVNCQQPQNGEPCNACLNCREITENRSLDVIEIDAASNRGIDEIRELRDKVGVRPGNSKYKVYVLDEAHMLTSEACNALLKTLEEPPPYVIFVLATTESHRMLATIISRCQRFDFKRISVRDIVAHLQHVAKEEGVTLEKGAADLLARAAAGGMRDALSMLDQAIAALGENVTLAGVQQMLGLADPHLVRELVEHVAYLRGADGLHLINRLAEAGADLRQLSAQVADYWRALMLAKAGADLIAVLDRLPEEVAEIQQLAQLFALDELSTCARFFSQNDVGARSISIPQLAVELSFIDCLHVHRQRTSGTDTAPSTRAAGNTAQMPANRPTPPARRGAAPALPATPVPSSPVSSDLPASPPGPARSVREEPVPPAASPAEDEQPVHPVARQDEAPAGEEILPPDAEEYLSPSQFGDEEEMSDESSFRPLSKPGLTLHDVQGQWEMIKKACKTKTPKLAALLNNAPPVAVNVGAESCEVVFRVEFDFHYKKLLEPENRSVVDWALREILQLPCRSRFLQKNEPIPSSTSPPPVSPAPLSETRQPPAAPSRSAMPGAAPENPPGLMDRARSAEQPSTALAAQNGHSAAHLPRQASAPQPQVPPVSPLETSVQRDPVIKEIMKTYGAKLVEWKPLGE
jgi:DNA polymerase-3 subunit gamma/tau